MLRHTSKVTVAVSGSTQFEYAESASMKAACQLLSQEFACNRHVLVLTGGMPGVGEMLGSLFEQLAPTEERLFHVLPKKHGRVPRPNSGTTFLLGETFPDRQLILGVSTRVLVVVGGGPGSVREANATLACGGIVLPLGATGGAAARGDFDLAHDRMASRIDFELAESAAVRKFCVLSTGEWEVLLQADVMAATATIAGLLARLTGSELRC